MVSMTSNEKSNDTPESESAAEQEATPAEGEKKSTTTRRSPARKSKASGGKSKAPAPWSPTVGELADVRVLVATDRMPLPKGDGPQYETATVTETLLAMAELGYVKLSEPGRG